MFNKNKSMIETDKSKLDNGIIKDLFIILAIYFGATFLSGVILGILYPIFANPAFGDMAIEEIIEGNNDIFLIISLFFTLISTFALYILAKNYYKRSKLSLGLRKEKSLRDYLFGAFLGIISVGIIVLFLYLSGNLEINLSMGQISTPIFILYFIGWIFQGFNEELLCRSILVNYFASKKSIGFAFIFSSAIFSLLHIFNDGFSILPCINIFLIRLVFSLCFYAFDNIAMSSGFHSFWNMAQANIFGISVSGVYKTKNTIFYSNNIGKDIINGGEFGIEGGLITTPLLLILVIIFYFFAKKKSDSFNNLYGEDNVY